MCDSKLNLIHNRWLFAKYVLFAFCLLHFKSSLTTLLSLICRFLLLKISNCNAVVSCGARVNIDFVNALTLVLAYVQKMFFVFLCLGENFTNCFTPNPPPPLNIIIRMTPCLTDPWNFHFFFFNIPGKSVSSTINPLSLFWIISE